jgi:alkane 1-monooxygenase
MMSKYVKGWLMPLYVALTILAFLQGGWWLSVPVIVTMGTFIIGDWILPHDTSEPTLNQSVLLNLPIYSILPLLVFMNMSLFWLLGTGDFIGMGAWVKEHAGIDMWAAREASTHWAMWVGAIAGAALLNATAGTVAGHELTHRTAKPFDLFLGRWMLAFTADTSFAIEHVYGHHVRIGTVSDPATARRGESFYQFTRRSTIFSYVHAYQLERARLAKLGKTIWNPLNSPFMMGNLENLSFFVVAYAMAGFTGLAIWFVVAFTGKQFLELTNYFEHYGLVREPSQPVQPRHSWNSNHWMSSNVLYSLARHSHHHAEADAPYWTLRAYPNAPMLPAGYLSMIIIALFPPLFKRLMVPALNAWDETQANPAERALARQASVGSGMQGLKIADLAAA